MPTINSVDVKITGDESGLKKATNEAQKDISKVGTSALSLGKIALGTGLGQLFGNVIAGAVRMVTQELDGAIERLDTINNYSKVMGNLGIGADDSAKSIDYLQEHLLGLPTSLNDAALAVQRFASVNKDIKASTVGFLALNNAILAGGAPMETQATALEQIAQAYSKGKPDAMEWRAMLTAMPAQMNQIAKAAGYSSAVIGGDFYNAIQSGKFSMNDFMATVVRLNTKGVDGFANFEEQARNATGGVQTSIANLKNAMQRGIATVLDTIGQANIAGFINGIASAIGTVANYIAAFVRLIKEAVSWLGVLFGFKTGGAEATAKQTKDTATNLGASANNANATAKGINNATKAAKKLNNQLAGFDEMNVLRENKSSGSGSGGAVGAGSFAIPKIDWGESEAKKKENQIEKILEKLRKAFDKFAKFLQPVARVIADVWKNYLAPFFGWVGNELMPAFLKAVGGALELLGTIIEKIWNVALKPFIDNFIVPIAQFTGGVIVGVLNAIGDALSFIAGTHAPEALAALLSIVMNLIPVVAAIAAGIVAWNAAATFLNNTALVFNKTLLDLPTLLSDTKLGMAGITAGFNAASTAANAATGASKLLGIEVGTLNGALQSNIVQLGLVGLAVTSLMTLYEAFKLWTMDVEAAERLYTSAQESAQQTTEWHNQAIQSQIDLKNQLKSIDEEITNAEYNLVNQQANTAKAMETLKEVSKKYGITTDEAKKYVEKLDLASGNLSDKDLELAKAVKGLEEQQNRTSEAVKKLNEKKDESKLKTQQLADQEWKEAMAQEKARIEAELAAGKYDEVADALYDLAQSSKSYTLENGKNVQLTKQDMEDMANFISQQLGQIDDDSGVVWRHISQVAGENVQNLKDKTSQEFITEMKKTGSYFADGIRRGIIDNQGRINSAASNSAKQAAAAFNKALQIHSPSRVMMQSGRFFVEGIESGIKKETNSLEQNVANIGETMVKAFDASAQLPDLASTEAADKLDAIAGKAQARLTVNAENTAGAIESLANAIVAMQEDKQPIVVKVGEETLVDTIVEGINNASTMRNRGVINI